MTALTPEPPLCECGAWSGEPCLPAEELVTIEWMPFWLRASHEAAGNSGVYPHNGAQRLRVSPECADLLLESEGDWARVVEPR